MNPFTFTFYTKYCFFCYHFVLELHVWSINWSIHNQQSRFRLEYSQCTNFTPYVVLRCCTATKRMEYGRANKIY